MTQSQSVIDWDRLLRPISADHPTGSDLRGDLSGDGLYPEIRRARADARSIERQLDFHTEEDSGKLRPNWALVQELAERILAEQSKDVEVAAYLIEAKLRLHGFAGLRDGLVLVRRLVEEYWPDLYPRADDGHTPELSHLAGLNGGEIEGSLIRPILTTPLTGGTSVGPFSCAHYLQARELEALAPKEREHRVQEMGQISMEVVLQSVAETPDPFFAQVRADLVQCQEEFQCLRAVLAEKCADSAPPTSNITQSLESCADTLRYLAGPSGEIAADRPEPLDSAPDPSVCLTSDQPMPGRIRTRDEALLALERVAEFYRRTEPHSPMSSAATQLARWGRMSLAELVDVLIPDEQARLFFRMRTGMDETDS